MFTDTHCHLAASPLRERLPEIMAVAQAAGVSRYLVPAIEPDDWQDVLSLYRQYRHHIAAVALGVHPWFARQGDDDLMRLSAILQEYSDIWVGEIGLDGLTNVPMQIQQWAFEQQISLAMHYHRPVIIHNVRATALVVATLKRLHWQGCGIVHAFSGSLEEANRLINMGFKIGLGSLLLNPKAKKVQMLATQLPLSAIVLETDSPFMLPNQINTPANVYAIAQRVAQLRGMAIDDLAVQTNENVDSLLYSV